MLLQRVADLLWILRRGEKIPLRVCKGVVSPLMTYYNVRTREGALTAEENQTLLGRVTDALLQ